MLTFDVIPQLRLLEERLGAELARVPLQLLVYDLHVRVVRTVLREILSAMTSVRPLLSQVLQPLVSSQRRLRHRLERAASLVAVMPLPLADVQMFLHLELNKDEVPALGLELAGLRVRRC